MADESTQTIEKAITELEELSLRLWLEVEKDDPDFVYGEALDNAYINLGNAVRSLRFALTGSFDTVEER